MNEIVFQQEYPSGSNSIQQEFWNIIHYIPKLGGMCLHWNLVADGFGDEELTYRFAPNCFVSSRVVFRQCCVGIEELSGDRGTQQE